MSVFQDEIAESLRTVMPEIAVAIVAEAIKHPELTAEPAEVLTLKEACELLRVSHVTLRKFREDGLKCIRLSEGQSTRFRFMRSDLLEYMKGRSQ